MGKSGDPRKHVRGGVESDFLIRPVRPGDGAALGPGLREWLGVDFDNVMAAIDARQLPAEVVVLCVQSRQSHTVHGGIIVAPPNRLLRQLGLSPSVADRLRQTIVKLEGVAVDPQVRGNGLGSLLVRRALSLSRSRGARWMYGQFESVRRLTSFYEQLGFRVHAQGAPMRLPAALDAPRLTLRSATGDQWFDQSLSADVSLAAPVREPVPGNAGLAMIRRWFGREHA